MKNILKIVWIILRSILILILIWYFCDTGVDHILYDAKISNFKSLATYNETISTATEKYYKVDKLSHLDKFKADELPGYYMKNLTMYPGNTTDIITSPNATLVNELISGIVTYTAGGHAGIIAGNYQDFKGKIKPEEIYEALGMEEGINPSRTTDRGFFTTDAYYKEVVVVRADLDEEKKDKVLSLASGDLGDPYNYSFGIFDSKNKSICTDLVSKVFDKVNVNLNKDGMFVTTYDLVISSDVHIVYYHYFKDGVKYTYYLE